MSRRKPRVQTEFHDPSLTVQSDMNQADIHHIIDKYARTGIVESMAAVDAKFLDVSEFTDYADLRRQTAEATQVFMSLPPQLRRVFNNDVYDWLDAAHDPDKLDALRPQLEKLGFPFPDAPEVPRVQLDTPPVEGTGVPSPQGNSPSPE